MVNSGISIEPGGCDMMSSKASRFITGPMMARIVAITGIAVAVGAGEARAVELITAKEAAMPDAVGARQLSMRGVTRAPKILVVSPAPDAGLVRSPLNLLLKFETHGGAVIDPLSVKVIYLKQSPINLTPRIGNLVTAGGIEVSGAEAPPGTHYIRVEVKDDAGRLGSIIFPLMVAN
jgi:hypothetical protein